MIRSTVLRSLAQTVSLLAFWVCALSAHPVHADRWIVPAAANVAGNAGTNWRTDLGMVNTGSEPVSVRVFLLKTEANNSALDRFFDVDVPADGQVEIEHVLATRFSFSGTAAVLLETDGSDLLVTSRTYNQVAQGSYGQFIPGVPVARGLGAGESGYLAYLTKSSEFRTNLGWAGTGPDTGSITISLHNAGGALLGTREYVIKPFGQQQVNDIFAAVGASPSIDVYATVTASVPVVAYASVVDNRTGDPMAVLAETAPTIAADLLLPGVARASGVANSLWRTDARILNAGTDAATVSLAYHPKNTAVTDPITVTMTIGVGQLIALDDVMLTTFGMTVANGGLRIKAGVPLIVLARTYNESADGTYGQSITADSYDGLIKVGDEVSFSGVRGGDFRSNVLFFNGGSSETELRLELFAANGTSVGVATTTLEGGEIDQINDVLSFFGSNKNGAPHTLKVSNAFGEPASAAVSVVMGSTGDPSYQTFRFRPFGQIGPCVDISPAIPGLVAEYEWGGQVGGLFPGGEGQQFEGQMIRTHTSVDQAFPYIDVTTSTDVVFEFDGIPAAFTTDSEDRYGLTLPEGHLNLVSSYTLQTPTFGGISFPIQTFDTSYSPAMKVGPAYRFCEGEVWGVPSVIETTRHVAGGETVVTSEATIAYTGRVVTVDEVLVTPAGAFPVVSWVTVTGSIFSPTMVTRQWVSIEHGVLIKQEVFHSDGETILSAIIARSIGSQ